MRQPLAALLGPHYRFRSPRYLIPPVPSLAPPFLAALRFAAEDAASLRRLDELRGRQELFMRQRPEVLETLRTAAVIERVSRGTGLAWSPPR
jgi:hypothetical protein